jgi:hypothetical protein
VSAVASAAIWLGIDARVSTARTVQCGETTAWVT